MMDRKLRIDSPRLTTRPVIVLVWSYKGGQGRTWAAANTAYWLAQESHRVLLVDFDYRAPGLPYFGLNMLVEPDISNLPPGLGTNKKALPCEGGVGLTLLEAVVRFWYWARDREGVGGNVDILWNRLGERLPDVEPEALVKDLMWTVPFGLRDDVQGAVFLAPCGDITDLGFQTYVGEGNPFRQVLHPRSDPARSAPVRFTDLVYVALARMAEEAQADFVIVDLPAGVSALAEMLLDPPDPQALEAFFRFGVPGLLLVVTSPARQAIDGSRRLVNGELTQRADTGDSELLPPVLADRRVLHLLNMVSPYAYPTEDDLKSLGLRDLTESERRVILGDYDKLIPKDRRGLLRSQDRGCFCPFIDEGALGEFIFPRIQRYRHRLDESGIQSESLPESISAKVPEMELVLNELGGALQRFLNSSSLLVPNVEDEVAGESAGMRGLTIFGENVPAFQAFCERLSAYGIEVVAYRGRHEDILQAVLAEKRHQLKTDIPGALDLFKKLGVRLPGSFRKVTVKRSVFRSGCEEVSEGSEVTELEARRLLDWAFNKCDLVAFPHYLLGYVWATRRRALTFPSKLVPEMQKPLEVITWAFSETCSYRGQWLMLPLTLLAKLLVIRDEPTAVTRWTWPQLLRRLKNRNDRVPALLTESRRSGDGSFGLSLWYEWNQFLNSCGQIEVARAGGEDLGRILLGNELSESTYNDFIRQYRELVELGHPDDKGKVDWERSGNLFDERRYSAWLGWTDWFWELKERGKLEDCGFLPLPRQEAVFPSQPLEGWGFLITQKGGEQPGLAEAIRQIFTIQWQRQWQQAGGCSPFVDVIRDPELQAKQPWLVPTAVTLERVVPKGKTSNVPLEIAAVAAYISRRLRPEALPQPDFNVLRELLERLVDHDS